MFVIKLKQIIESKDSKDVAGIAYIVDSKLLCVQDPDGDWGIPKGHIHIDETPEEGAYREFSEETQIILNKPIKFSHKSPKSKGCQFHVFMCKGDKEITAHIGHEHIDWGYYSSNNLPQPFDERVVDVINNLYEASPTSNIKGMKGATGFIKPEEWEAKKKSLKKSIENSTGYLLLERIDLLDTAEQIIKKYKLKSKVKFTSGSTKADYDWVTDTINLRKSYPGVKDFLITVLHEIKHALDRKKMGAKKYEKYYSIAGELAVQKGGDFHDDNKFEEIAEKWGKREYRKWKNKVKEVVRESSSNNLGYSADAGEPDTGFLAAGLPRILGINNSKPEPWFEKGGYTQEEFPQADEIYDASDTTIPIIQVIKKIANIGDKYEGYQDDVASWEKYGYKDYALEYEE
jgi:8-oxo-dGTP pyrophosphatase MutT (NUDIX family)